MDRKERICAAVACQEVDKIPFGMWCHLPEVDQDPVSLAGTQIKLALDYELDFIKMMPFGNYQAADYGLSCKYYCQANKAVKEIKFAIDNIQEWGDIRALPGCFGNHGKALMAARQLKKQQKKLGLEIPYIQTIFSPLSIARKLAGDRVLNDMRTSPELIHHALMEMTKTSIDFCMMNIEEGVAGFFFATQCSTYDLATEAEYKEFGEKYDLMILNAVRPHTYFNVMHDHGENTMFELLSKYPIDAINWHDRWVYPSLSEARKLTGKCLMGGINENWIRDATPEQIGRHIEEAVSEGGRRGLILSPGCGADMATPRENFLACAEAIKRLQPTHRGASR